MIGLATRLRRLEEKSEGPCPLCRNRRGNVIETERIDASDPETAEEALVEKTNREAGRCPLCGRPPDVVKVLEIVVVDRDEADRRIAELCAASGQARM